MKASTFSEAQIAFVLKQADDVRAISGVRRKAGIGQATHYNRHKKYAAPAAGGKAPPAAGAEADCLWCDTSVQIRLWAPG